MAVKKRLVVANWKMHPGTLVEARRLFSSIARKVARVRNATVVICPPTLFLSELAVGYSGTTILFGAQDISTEIKEGSFTGEVSGAMLKRAGATYVIVGHSERRTRGETNEVVAEKMASSLASGLTPVLCVGEHQRDSEGHYLKQLEHELISSLRNVSRQKASRIIVAYEPLWAIGKTSASSVTPDDLHQMSLFIKKVLVKNYGRKIGSGIRILYGGSVEPSNDDGLMQGGGVDGFLVGHASLVADDFVEVVKNC